MILGCLLLSSIYDTQTILYIRNKLRYTDTQIYIYVYKQEKQERRRRLKSLQDRLA